MRIRLLAMLTVGCVMQAEAQTLARVKGIAYDSLGARGLPGAFVTLGSLSTVADTLGRFAFDAVAPGTHRLTVQHDVLDSLGLPGLVTSLAVVSTTDTVRIATPSAETMWRRVCRTEPSRDSGFVFGVVREAATRKAANDVAIVATWIDLRSLGTSVSQKGWRLESRSGADGAYVLCGLPIGAGVRLQAASDSTAFAVIDVALSQKSPVQRHDLSMSHVLDSVSRGVVRGVVTADGRPVSNARVETDGVPETRTAANGGFTLRNVPAGTRQLHIQGIGFAPAMRVVDVMPGDTAVVTISVNRVTVLDSMRVIAPSARTRLIDQFEARRRRGIGYFLDSEQIGKSHFMSGVFAGIPTVRIDRANTSRQTIEVGNCRPVIWIDRAWAFQDQFAALRPEDIAALEVYRMKEIPSELTTQMGLGVNSELCAVVVWTKRGWR